MAKTLKFNVVDCKTITVLKVNNNEYELATDIITVQKQGYKKKCVEMLKEKYPNYLFSVIDGMEEKQIERFVDLQKII